MATTTVLIDRRNSSVLRKSFQPTRPRLGPVSESACRRRYSRRSYSSSSALTLLVADNPAKLMIHCHNLEHVGEFAQGVTGLAFNFVIVP